MNTTTSSNPFNSSTFVWTTRISPKTCCKFEGLLGSVFIWHCHRGDELGGRDHFGLGQTVFQQHGSCGNDQCGYSSAFYASADGFGFAFFRVWWNEFAGEGWIPLHHTTILLCWQSIKFKYRVRFSWILEQSTISMMIKIIELTICAFYNYFTS
jgi:hypothetical protein